MCSSASLASFECVSFWGTGTFEVQLCHQAAVSLVAPESLRFGEPPNSGSHYPGALTKQVCTVAPSCVRIMIPGDLNKECMQELIHLHLSTQLAFQAAWRWGAWHQGPDIYVRLPALAVACHLLAALVTAFSIKLLVKCNFSTYLFCGKIKETLVFTFSFVQITHFVFKTS